MQYVSIRVQQDLSHNTIGPDDNVVTFILYNRESYFTDIGPTFDQFNGKLTTNGKTEDVVKKTILLQVNKEYQYFSRGSYRYRVATGSCHEFTTCNNNFVITTRKRSP